MNEEALTENNILSSSGELVDSASIKSLNLNVFKDETMVFCSRHLLRGHQYFPFNTCILYQIFAMLLIHHTKNSVFAEKIFSVGGVGADISSSWDHRSPPLVAIVHGIICYSSGLLSSSIMPTQPTMTCYYEP